MANLQDLVAIARKTGEQSLPAGFVREVLIEPADGADGSEVLRVQFVVNGDPVAALDGDMLVDTIVELSTAFQKLGDQRSPMVEYLTEAELVADDDPES